MQRVTGWVKRHPVWSSIIGGFVALFILAAILGEEPQEGTPAKKAATATNTTATKTETVVTTVTEKAAQPSKPTTAPRTTAPKPKPKAAPKPKPKAAPKPKPAPKPAPAPAPAPAPKSACAPGYSPCLPISDDLDCGDIDDSKKPITVTGSDPYGLDFDGDGVGCELG